MYQRIFKFIHHLQPCGKSLLQTIERQIKRESTKEHNPIIQKYSPLCGAKFLYEGKRLCPE